MDYIKYNIANLYLHNFRNHQDKYFEFRSHVNLISGSNGCGKTSVLEAISLLSLGKGLKSADGTEMLRYGERKSAITTKLDSQIGNITLKCELQYDDLSNKVRKKYFLDDKSITTRNTKMSYINCVWLIPQMDNFFLQENNLKRKFIDRLIAQLDSQHMQRLLNYDKLLKERNKLLELYSNNKWLNLVEEKIAPLGVAICVSRMQFVEHINKYLSEHALYPMNLKFSGKLEDLFLSHKYALSVEKEYLKLLCENRSRDSLLSMCEIGAHKSKLESYCIIDNTPVDNASTGEQKIMLITILIGYIKMVFNLEGIKPILLLDEVNVHLDMKNTNLILQELFDLGNQIFVTSVEENTFSTFKDIIYNIKL